MKLFDKDTYWQLQTMYTNKNRPLFLRKATCVIMAPQRGLEPRTWWLTVTGSWHFRVFLKVSQ
jgi:hypothetical protein